MLVPKSGLPEIYKGAGGEILFSDFPSKQLALINLVASIFARSRRDRCRFPASKDFQGHVGGADAHQLVGIRETANDAPAEIIVGRSVDRSACDVAEGFQYLRWHKGSVCAVAINRHEEDDRIV